MALSKYLSESKERRAEGLFAAASVIIAEGLGEYPDSFELQAERAWIAMGQENWSEAAQLWEAILRTRNDDAPLDVFLGLSVAYRRRGTWDDADRLIGRIVAQRNPPIEARLEYGRIAAERGDPVATAQRINDILSDREALSDEAYVELADIYKRAGMLAEAEGLIGAALGKFPKSKRALTAYARLATARKDWPAAIDRWTKVRDRSAKEGPRRRAEISLATAHIHAGAFDRARILLNELANDEQVGQLAREQLAILERKEIRSTKDPWEYYWHIRKDYIYLFVCRKILELIGRSARTVVDVGSNRTPILEWMAHVGKRYSVDLTTPYVAPGIISVAADFMQWKPAERIDIGTCFQVMEHIPEPATQVFAQHLLATCEVVLISVPYMEEAGRTSTHVNHSIDLQRIAGWFGRPPNYHYIATELSGEERMIALFDTASTNKITALNAESREVARYRFRWSLGGPSGAGDPQRSTRG